MPPKGLVAFCWVEAGGVDPLMDVDAVVRAERSPIQGRALQ